MQLRYSVAAGDDLVEVWNTLAPDNRLAADRLPDAFDAKCQRLVTIPFIGVARDDLRPGLRMLIAGEYVILYRVTEANIEIMRIVHGKRDLEGLMS